MFSSSFSEGGGFSTDRPHLVVHQFRAQGPEGEEVRLDPCESLVEVASANDLGCDVLVVESNSPMTGALGALPAGLLDGRVAQRPVLQDLFERALLVASDTETTTRAPRWLPANAARVLAAARAFTLWAHPPCFRGYTRPAVARSMAFRGSWLAGAWYCRGQRQEAMRVLGFGSRSPSARELAAARDAVAKDFAALAAAFLMTRMEARAPNCSGEANLVEDVLTGGCCMSPDTVEELMLYAHVRPILDVPCELLPWSRDLRGLSELRSFVAELDKRARTGRSRRSTMIGDGDGYGRRLSIVSVMMDSKANRGALAGPLSGAARSAHRPSILSMAGARFHRQSTAFSNFMQGPGMDQGRMAKLTAFWEDARSQLEDETM